MGRIESRLLAVTAIAIVVAVLMAVEALGAVTEQKCAVPGSGVGCYPWGNEGPVAGTWRYASKANYLISGFVPLVVELAVIAFLRRQTRLQRSLSLLQGISVAGIIGAPFLLLLL